MRGAACRDKKNTGVKNPWKELPGERKGGRNLLRSHDAFVRFGIRGPTIPPSRYHAPLGPSRDQIKRVVFFVHQDSVHQILPSLRGKPASSDQQIALSFSPKGNRGGGVGYGTILFHPRRRSRRRVGSKRVNDRFLEKFSYQLGLISV